MALVPGRCWRGRPPRSIQTDPIKLSKPVQRWCRFGGAFCRAARCPCGRARPRVVSGDDAMTNRVAALEKFDEPRHHPRRDEFVSRHLRCEIAMVAVLNVEFE